MIKKIFFLLALYLTTVLFGYAEDGHDLWLRYNLIQNQEVLESYKTQFGRWDVIGESTTTVIIDNEIMAAFSGLLGRGGMQKDNSNKLTVAAKGKSPLLDGVFSDSDYESMGSEGYMIKSFGDKDLVTLITANTDIGLLYGTFHLLRLMQNEQDISNLNIVESPKIDIRILNHWDNLDRTSERGYAGFAIWDWHRLPGLIKKEYHEYARACASVGINATVPINVNSNALILTPMYLEKVKALADVFRPYGIKMYLTARFSAPMEIGGLETADPLDEGVKKWWADKAKEIYEYVPDFGGFLVKANSEGQPGPHEYKRTHAEGANMLADALKPFGGVVMWRAFVYSEEDPDDRHKQAYTQFVPMDGTFRDNVIIQVKNGAIDFQPREPFHPMFGAMPKTPLMMEFQITQEYLGQATQLVYMGPYYEEVLNADTYADGEGSTVGKVIDGSLHNYPVTAMAGVANTGTDRNWTGHLFGQSNWYVFGRMAWNPNLSASEIADEWVGMTFGNSEDIRKPIKEIMMASRETAVNSMTPLGLGHLMATGHHYGPGPWVSELGRPEWNPYYYHKSDSFGIGFDRTKTGSNALAQYSKPVQKIYGNLKKIDEKDLLWFHHVSWDHKMKSGNILWDELCGKYQDGVESVRDFKIKWNAVQGKIDNERWEEVRMLLNIHEKEVTWWKDASLLYFQTYSKKEFPSNIEQPKGTLEYYKNLRFPYSPGIRPRW